MVHVDSSFATSCWEMFGGPASTHLLAAFQLPLLTRPAALATRIAKDGMADTWAPVSELESSS